MLLDTNINHNNRNRTCEQRKIWVSYLEFTPKNQDHPYVSPHTLVTECEDVKLLLVTAEKPFDCLIRRCHVLSVSIPTTDGYQ